VSRADRLHAVPTRLWLLLIMIPFAVAIAILAYRFGENQVKDRRDRVILALEARVNRKQQRILTELCKTNAIIEGLVSGSVDLFEYEIGILPPRFGPEPPLHPPLVDPRLVPVYQRIISTFLGWRETLRSQTACERVTP
jgi:hypothetical protein